MVHVRLTEICVNLRGKKVNFAAGNKWYLKLGSVALLGLLPSAASANLSTGTFNAVGNVSLSLGQIKFTNQPVFSVGTQDFASVSFNGSKGTLKTINNPPNVIDAVFATPSFLTFVALPGITLTLLTVQGGTFGTTLCGIGGPCSPANTPFNLFNQGTSAVASFAMTGFETDGVHTTPFTAIFSETFPRTKYQTIVAAWNLGKSVNTTYSASFEVVPAPEPVSFFPPLAAGFIAMLVLKRRSGFGVKPASAITAAA